MAVGEKEQGTVAFVVADRLEQAAGFLECEELDGVGRVSAARWQGVKSYVRSRDDPSPILFLSRRGEPISRRMLDWLMKDYAAAAGIGEGKRHFHVLKHSIATHFWRPAEEPFRPFGNFTRPPWG